jgi:hypothetical protein
MGAVHLGLGLIGNIPPMPLAIGVGVVVLVLGGLAFRRFSRREADEMDPDDREAMVRNLEARGLLVATDYRADRAFRVEEFEDEGFHYFVELEDGSVLYLNGRYLNAYEPVDDDPMIAGGRRFPCTEFTVRRHKELGYVVDLQCRGEALEPERTRRAFTRDDYVRGDVPEDGEVIRGQSYDQLKAERG